MWNIQNLRPRERLLRLGPEALSTVELLALILRTGTRGIGVMQLAHELMLHYGSLEQLLMAPIEELILLKGVGKVKAIQLKACLSLGFRLLAQGADHKMPIQSAEDVYSTVREMLTCQTEEHFVALMLDARRRLVKKQLVSVGTLTQTLVHPREVFHAAIRHKAASIVLAHNHPSGDLTPSPQDISLTKTLIDVGQLMLIPVVDHVIVSNKGYLSLRNHGSLANLFNRS